MQLFTNDDHNSHNEKNDSKEEYSKQSKRFREAIITLRLGALVVHLSSNDMQGAESASDIEARLKKSISRQRIFSPEEKAQLHIYLLHRLKALESIREVKTELTCLALSKKRRVRYILLSIIFANGYHTPTKQQHIEKLYLALGLNKLMLKDDISILFSTNSASQNKQISTKTNIVTNDKKLILNVKNSPKKRIKSSASSEIVTASYNQQSLTNKRINLYNHLIKKEIFSKKEFNHLCQYYKLSPNGALEIINNWAYQQVATPVLMEEENVIRINMDIVLKIQQKTTTVSPKVHCTMS